MLIPAIMAGSATEYEQSAIGEILETWKKKDNLELTHFCLQRWQSGW